MTKKIRIACLAVLLAATLGMLGATGPQQGPVRKISPPYTVMVALQATSPFVADGRMSIADLAFSATFKNVVVVVDRAQGAFLSQHYSGKVLLTRHEFNDVDSGDDRHRPWVKKPWPMEFPASLVSGWLEKEDEEEEAEIDEDVDDMPLAKLTIPKTIHLGFYARFGLLDLEWISKLGTCVLSNMLFEFEQEWRPLLDGKPVTLKLPYEGDYEGDQGTWWIEFIPEKAGK